MHSKVYQLRHHRSLSSIFQLTKSMIKPKIKASKRRSMSAFNNKILFEKKQKGTGKQFNHISEQQYGSIFQRIL